MQTFVLTDFYVFPVLSNVYCPPRCWPCRGNLSFTFRCGLVVTHCLGISLSLRSVQPIPFQSICFLILSRDTSVVCLPSHGSPAHSTGRPCPSKWTSRRLLIPACRPESPGLAFGQAPNFLAPVFSRESFCCVSSSRITFFSSPFCLKSSLTPPNFWPR